MLVWLPGLTSGCVEFCVDPSQRHLCPTRSCLRGKVATSHDLWTALALLCASAGLAQGREQLSVPTVFPQGMMPGIISPYGMIIVGGP